MTEIAVALDLSVKTVSTYRMRLLSKTAVEDHVRADPLRAHPPFVTNFKSQISDLRKNGVLANAGFGFPHLRCEI